MTIFEILHRLIDAAAGRVLHEAEQKALHAHVDTNDPSVPSPEEAAAEAERAQAAAKAEQDEFAEFQAFKARQRTANSDPAGSGG